MLRKFDARRHFIAFFAGLFAIAGTIVAVDTPALAVTGDASTVDYALSFNGTSDQLEAAEGTQYVSRAIYTVQAWINPSNVTCSTSNCPVASHDGDWWFGIQNGTYQYLIYHTSTGQHSGFIDTGIKAVANTWTHLSLVRNGAAVSFYVDGVLVKSNTLSGSGRSTYTPFPLKVGRHYNSEYFTGLIDELKIWSTIRDSSAIATDMHTYQTSASSTTGLVAYFDFNEGGTNTTINNRVGSGANLTFSNANPTVNFVDVKSTSKLNGKTVVTFPRSYLTPALGWTVPAGSTRAEYLAVAGGGSGGSRHAGGGGAGELKSVSGFAMTPGNALTVKVGQGGVALPSSTSGAYAGANGQDTVLGSTTLVGGGRGAGGNYQLTLGGGGNTSAVDLGTIPSPTEGLRNVGGQGITNNSRWLGGGGGGAMSAGLAAYFPSSGAFTTSGIAGAGGSGFQSSITGTAVCYAAGGGGGSEKDGERGLGGSCAGGAASTAGDGSKGSEVELNSGSFLSYTQADPNSGSGGGGGGYGNTWNGAGGNGGSGVVIIAYAPADDTAFDFASGVDGQLQATNKQVVPSKASYTFETWLKADSVNSTGFNLLFRQQATSSNFNAFGVGMYQGQLQALHSIQDSDPGTFNTHTSGDSLTKIVAGRWYHVAISTSYSVSSPNSTYEMKIFVNGQLASTTTKTYATSALSTLGSAEVSIGNYYSYGSTHAWDGKLDQMKVWNGALTQAEILKSMNAYSSESVVETSGSTLRAHYDFNTSDTSNLIDQTGNGYNFSLKSGATAASVYQVAQTASTSTKTTVIFDRSILNTWGGWVSSITTSIASALVVGGGGGAGKGTAGNAAPAGSGGGGGVAALTSQSLSASTIYPVIIGQGGQGAAVKADDASTRNGQSSKFGTTTVLGGGGGGSNGFTGAGGSGLATGGGGGGNSSNSCVLGNAGGAVTSGFNGSRGCWGWGGAGGGASAAATDGVTNSNYGKAGAGVTSSISGSSVAYGTGGFAGDYSAIPATIVNSGTGGNVQYGGTAPSSGAGTPGQAGIVIVSVKTANAITFDAGGGSGTMSVQNINVGSSAALTSNAFTKNSDTFSGWATSSGGAVVYADAQSITPTTDLTLYAVWANSLSAVNVQFDELIFDYATAVHIVGTNGKSLNDKVLFLNVTTKGGVQVDALVTTEVLSGATIANYESGTGAGGANGYFQADVDIAAANGYAQFKFDFYQHGVAGSAGNPCAASTNTGCTGATKVKLQNVNVSAIDIDYNQWNDFTAVESYTVAGNSQTKLKECVIPGSGTCTARVAPTAFPSNMRFQGSADTARTNDPVDMAIVTYAEIETFKIKFGRSAIGKPNYYGVAFKALSWGVQTPSTAGGTSYTVSYAANGATGTAPTSSTGVVGANVTLPAAGALTKAGYTFAGWNTAADGTGTTYSAANVIQMPNGGLTLYAKWTANQYMLIYKLYGGVNGPATEMRTTGSTANLSATQPVRDGSVFSSWNTAADGSGTTYAPSASFTMLPANTTLHAMYSNATGTIAYNANGGASAPTGGSGTSGTTATVAAAGGLNRTNYTFSGWNTAALGTGTDYVVGATITYPANGVTTTLFAQWTPVLYSITYNANGGTGTPASGSNIAGSAVTIASSNTTRTGFTFDGWTTAADGSGTVYSYGGANPTLTMPGANTVLYAKWTAVSYTLSFNANSGTNAPNALTGNYGATLTIPAAPTAPSAKKFNGWNTLIGGGGSTYAVGGTYQLTGNSELFAQWVDDTVNLFYSANGGSNAPSSLTATANQNTTLSPTVPTRTGYNFAGWTAAANGTGTVYGSSSTFPVPGSDTTLYANWTPINYNFIYNANGGSGAPATVTYHIGEFVIVDNSGNTARNGYTFNGWNTALDGSGSDYLGGQSFLMPNADTTLFAKWISNPYTLTYNANGGSAAPAPETRNAGSVANLSATVPTRSGYTFNGWNSTLNGGGTNYNSSAAFTMATSNATLYAQWVLNSNAVSYNANSGTGAPSGASYNFGTTVAVSSTLPTRTGYNFLGWNTALDGTGTGYDAADTFLMPDSSVVLYARWSAIQKTFTYDANGGSGVQAIANYAYGSTVTVTSTQPSRPGYSFVGWNSMADGTGTTSLAAATFTMPANDVTLYAIWSVNAYTVYYNMNGGTGAINPQPGTYNTNITVSATSPSRTGFTFSGWNTLADGTGTDYTAGLALAIPASNVTLYAKWTAIFYSVSYNANGGTNAPANITGVSAGVLRTLSGSAPLQNGFVFNGWNTASDGSGLTYAGGQSYLVPPANTVLFAQWVANTYQIIYNPNGGTGAPAASNGTTNSTIALSTTVPTRPGFDFVRWNIDVSDADTNTRYASGANFVVPAGNTIFYAIWTPANITVSFDINGGSGTTPGSSTDKYLETITLAAASAFSRSGYTFNGWNTLADGTGSSYAAEANFVMPDSNQTLFAQWSQIFYAIEYSANGGSGEPADQFAPPGQNINVAATEPIKSGYDFDSWTLVNQGTTVLPGATISMPSTNVVLVANWVRIASVPGGSSSPVVTPTPEPTKPPTPTPSPTPTVKPAASKLSLTVYFKGDSAVLQPLAKIQLNALAKKARAKGSAFKIQVIGRVKETSDKSYDLRLSKQRATNVANYLKRLGVKGNWAVTAAGISPENKPISRRTDIFLTWK